MIRKARFGGIAFALLITLALSLPGIGVRAFTPQDPGQGTDVLRFARSLYQDGLYDLAVDELRRQLDGGLPPAVAEEARWLLPDVLEAAGRHFEAATALLEFTRRHGSSARAPQAFLRAGSLFLAIGDPSSAAGAYLDFLRLFPENDQRPQATAGLIAAHLDEERYAEALDRASSARRDFPFHPLQPRFLLYEARARFGLGEIELAYALSGEAQESAAAAEVKAEAATLRARILLQTGRPGEAALAAQAAIEAPAPESILPRLRSMLGAALVRSGRPQEALPELRAAVGSTTGAEQAEAAAWQARAHAALGEPDSSLAAFDVAIGLLQSEAAAAVALEAADLAIGRSWWQRVMPYAELALEEAATPGTRLEATERIVRALAATDHPGEAIDRYRSLLSTESGLTNPQRGRAWFDMGRIHGEALGNWTSAGSAYRQAALAAGSGELWSRSLWFSAEALARQGDYASAVVELQPVVSAAGPMSRQAATRIAYWREYRVVDLRQGLQDIQEALIAIAAGGESGRRESLLAIARANARSLKDFETAVSAYDRYLASGTQGRDAARAYLEKGRALQALAVIAEEESGGQGAAAWNDQAAQAFSAAVRTGGESSESEEAQLALIHLDLVALANRPVLYYQAMRDRYRAFLEQFPATSRTAHVLEMLAAANEGLGQHADASYYEEAAAVWRLLLEGNRPPDVTARAVLGLGRSLYLGGAYGEAFSHLESALSDLPEGASRDEVLFMAGDARMQTGDAAGAVVHLRELEDRYPDSPWTALASEATGDLLMQQDRAAEASASYRRFLEGAPAADLGRAHLKLASALALTPEAELAREQARLAATDSLIGDDDRRIALRLWGEMAREAGEEGEAYAAWNALWVAAPTSVEAVEIAPAFGDLLSRRGEVNLAEQVWRAVAAASTTSDSLRARAAAEMVFLGYAGGNIAVGQQRQEEFESTYRRDRDVLARYRPLFWTVEAQVHMQRREWGAAEDLYDEIVDNASDSRYMPGALYGLGVVALRSVDPDQASERELAESQQQARESFEELIRRFPDAAEADRARYDLGQLHYILAEYEFAVPLFREVASCGDRALEELGQFYLVETLHRMQEWDAAQQEALTYMQRFPDADDVFDMQMRLGRLYREGGQPGRAATYFRSLNAEGEENQARLRFQLAETLFVLGEYENAVLEYLKVAYLNEDQFLFAVTARLRAADSYAYLGQRDRAIGMYEDIIQRYGAASEYGRIAQAHLENVRAGRAPAALPPPQPPPASRAR